jgi:hypothetical protein
MWWGLVGGGGAAIMFLSRPFEGATVLAIVGGVAVVDLLRRPRQQTIRHLVAFTVGALVALAPAAAWQLYYNWRVTGEPLTMPYTTYTRQYVMAPPLYWQPLRNDITYRSLEFRRFSVEDEYEPRAAMRSVRGFLRGTSDQLWGLIVGYVNPEMLLLPLIAAVVPLVRRRARGGALSRRRRALLWAISLVLLAPLIHVLCSPWMRIAYMAPSVAGLSLWLMLGLRALARWRVRRLALGRGLACAVVVAQVFAVVLIAWRLHAIWSRQPGEHRVQVVNYLRQQPGDHLVVVRYGPRHDVQFEWVWNDADVPHAKIVFARYSDAASNRQLIESYPGRRLWGLDVNDGNARLTPLSPGG